MKKLIYQDAQAETVLAGLPQVLEKHSLLLCDTDRPVPGLSCFEKRDSRWDTMRSQYVIATPWGDAQEVYDVGRSVRYSGILPLYRLYDPSSNAPKAQAPMPGHAVLDILTGIATVYTQNGQPDPEVVYTTRISNLETRTGKEALRLIRADLAMAGVPVYPGELYGESSIPYPWDDEGDFSAPIVRNGEVAVSLVGYVVNPETQEVVYLHIVGAKTALRSIWGTLSNGGTQTVNIAAGRQVTGYTSHNYATFASSLDDASPAGEGVHLYRLVITDQQAIAPDVVDRAYLIIPKEKSDDLDLGQVFAARLNALLPIPILPQWGQTLRQYGIRRELLHPCLYGGDVEQAYLITKDGWVELVKDLVQEGELSITE
jgi:hypothetical protein